MMTIQNYVRAQSLQQAYDLCQNRRNRIVAGMLWLRQTGGSVNTAVDLCDLGLDTIEETDDAFVIGAMTPLRKLELHPGFAAYTGGAAARALGDIVGVQFRNLATVGGSVYGRFGFSDVLTLLLALDAEVELYGAGRMPLAQFAELPQTTRDLLVRIYIKKTPGFVAYRAVRIARTDFPVLTCAASRLDGKVRLCVGARPGKAMVLDLTDAAGDLTPDTVRQLAEQAEKQIPTGSNSRGSAAYRSHLVRVLAKRTLSQVGGFGNGD